MPITNTQEIYEIRSISPMRINPSITEGQQQLTSILGSKRDKTIVRYAPIFLTAPQIQGDPGIPSTLFCTPGTVDSSPSAYRTYQWYINGVADQFGVGSEFAYFTTDPTMDSRNITCLVTAINQVGEASALSNTVFVSLIEPVIVGEFQWFSITGLPAEDHITFFMDQIFVTTGMWVDEVTTMFSKDIFGISGMAHYDHIGINHFDVYGGLFFTLLDTVTIPNGGAESGTASWTVTAGSIRSVTCTPATGTSGTKAFRGTPARQVFTAFRQTMNIPSDNDAEIDAGIAYCSVSFQCTRVAASTFNGGVNAYYSILDNANVVLSTHEITGGFFEPRNTIDSNQTNFWQYIASVPALIPVLGRKITVFFELEDGSAGVDDGNICQIDQIAITLFRLI